MFSNLKIAHAVHLVSLKVFTAKTVVELGMVVGTAATCYVISGNTLDDYIDRTILLIDHEVAAHSDLTGSGSLMADVGMHPRTGTDLATGFAPLAQAPEKLFPASWHRLDTGPIGEARGTGDLVTEQRAAHGSASSQPSAMGN